MRMKIDRKGCIAAISSGFLYGVLPLAILSVSSNKDVTSSFVLMLRMFFASIFLLPVAVLKKGFAAMTRAHVMNTFAASFFLTVTSILIYSAYLFVPSGIGMAVHYTYPIFCTVINLFIFREKPSLSIWICIIFSVFGVALLSDLGRSGEGSMLGLGLALISSLTFTCYLEWLERKNLRSIDCVSYTCLMCLFSGLTLLVYNAFTGALAVQLQSQNFVMFPLIGLIAALAIVTQAYAVPKIGSMYASIFGTTEPIVCAIAGFLFLGEALTAKSLIGIFLVLFAVVVITVAEEKS